MKVKGESQENPHLKELLKIMLHYKSSKIFSHSVATFFPSRKVFFLSQSTFFPISPQKNSQEVIEWVIEEVIEEVIEL